MRVPDPPAMGAPDAVPPSLAAAAAAAAAYAADSRAASTRSAYAADWAAFTAWCANHDVAALPASAATVAMYLASEAARLRPITLNRKLSAIAAAHAAAGLPFDRKHRHLAPVWAGIRRRHGVAPVAACDAVTPAMLAAMAQACDDTPRGRRDRAMLTLAFAAALRPGEVVALQLSDLRWQPGQLLVTVQRGKRDQDGKGSLKVVQRDPGSPTCAMTALAAWLRAARLSGGPLFRAIHRGGALAAAGLNVREVGRIVVRAAGRVAPPSGGKKLPKLSGHSLRVGYVTAAANAGVPWSTIMNQTGHRDIGTLTRYMRQIGVVVDGEDVMK